MKTDNKFDLYVLLPFIFFLFIYVALRSYYLDFTHDESLAFFIVNRIGAWWDSTTNHLLITAAMWSTQHLFGTAEWVLRLCSTLSFLLWAISILCIGRFLLLPLRIFLIATLLLCPFLLDFFSLARGYSLGIAFQMAALYFLIQWLNNKKADFVPTMAIVCAALSVWANFSFLNFFIAFLGVIAAFSYRNFLLQSFKSFLLQHWFIVLFSITTITISTGAMLLFAYRGVMRLWKVNNLWNDTLFVLARDILYRNNAFSWKIDIIRYTIILLAVGILFFLTYTLRTKRNIRTPTIILSILWGIVSLFFLIQHIVFALPYPYERTAVSWWTLFVVAAVFFLNEMVKNYRFAAVGVLFPIGWAVWNLFINLQLSYSLETGNDQGMKYLMQQVHQHIAQQKIALQTVDLGVSWTLEPTANFYRLTMPLPVINTITRQGIFNKTYTYYIAFDDEIQKLKENNPNVVILAHYKETQVSLAYQPLFLSSP